MQAYVVDSKGTPVLHIWYLPVDMLREYFERHTLEDLESFWKEHPIGMIGPPASVLFDVMRAKGGEKIVKRLTHEQTDYVLSRMVGMPICYLGETYEH